MDHQKLRGDKFRIVEQKKVISRDPNKSDVTKPSGDPDYSKSNTRPYYAYYLEQIAKNLLTFIRG